LDLDFRYPAYFYIYFIVGYSYKLQLNVESLEFLQQVFTDRMLFTSPYKQRRNTEGTAMIRKSKMLLYVV